VLPETRATEPPERIGPVTPYAEELAEAVWFRRADPHQTTSEAERFDDAVEITRRWA
jgi:hypothetical protein